MINYFAEHPTAANLLMLAFIIVGVFSLPSIRRELMPDFESDEVQISYSYPGATAEEVDESVCRRIEEALESISNMKEIRSTASEGQASIVAEMEDGANFQTFLDDIKTEIDSIDDLPDDVENKVVKSLNRKDAVANIAITGFKNPAELKNFCEELKDKLKVATGIAQIDVSGFSDRQLKIKVDRDTLMKYGLDTAKLASIISEKSVELPGGTLETENQDFLIKFSDRRKNVSDLSDLVVVSGDKGAEIKLGDIAEIVDDFEDHENLILFNGERAGVLEFSKNKQDDTLRAYDAILQYLENEPGLFPAGVKWYVTGDRASHVRSRLEMVTNNGIQGFFLVFLALWLFFSFRFSFWVTMGLPISFLGALALFPVLGFSLNMISMVALLVGIGLLMDDAIVISENIATHLAKGDDPLKAAVNGSREVAQGVLASFATTICVFGPLAFISGRIGKIMRVLPAVLILVLAVSLIEAFLILPHHLAHSLKNYNDSSENSFRKFLNNLLEWFRENVVGRIADFAIEYRYFFMSCVLSLFIISISVVASGKLKFRLFPDIDGDTVQIGILMPQGTPLAKTGKVVDKVLRATEKLDKTFTRRQPGRKKFVRQVSVEYSKHRKSGESGAHVATINIDILKGEERSTKINTVLDFLRKEVGEIPEALSLTFRDRQPGPGGDPVAIRISGQKLAELKAAALLLEKKLSEYPGVFDLTDDLRSGKPEITLKLREGASRLGISAKSIANQLRSSFQGGKIDDIQVGKEEFEVVVYMSDATDRDNMFNLDYFFVTLPSGKRAPLSALATLTPTRGFSKITNVDGAHTVTVSGDINRKAVNASEFNKKVFSEILPQIKRSYPGISFAAEGERKETSETGNSLLTAFLTGILGIFLLLCFQFRSYIDPLFVMAAIPLAIIGVIWGHVIMGWDMTMPSVIGFVSLSGIVVNDSILVVEFLKNKMKEGADTITAAKFASRARFRAVMLTSLTTIAGLLPISFEKSIQAQIVIPLAISLASGLIASTLLVLFVIPALYSIKVDIVRLFSRLKAHARQPKK